MLQMQQILFARCGRSTEFATKCHKAYDVLLNVLRGLRVE
jgi:hypothetical protein